jgi:hypothetical protein
MSMSVVFAQAGIASTLGVWAMMAVVVIAIIALLVVAVRTTGIQVPAWVIQVGWIVAAAVVILLAIRLLLTFI